MAENDSPQNGFILAAVVLTVLSLVAIVVGVDQYYRFAVQDEVQAKVLSRENIALKELRAREKFRLQNYTWVDKQAGLVTIPVERARELVLSGWAARPAEPVPGSAAKLGASQPPPPAPGTAPTDPAAPAPTDGQAAPPAAPGKGT